MKKTLITVLAAAIMLYGTCGTAFSVELNLKNLKDAVKKDFEQKREAQKGGKEQENGGKQEAAGATAASSGSTGSKTAAAAPAANTEPNSEDDFDFTVNDDFTEITITRYKGTRKDVVIPASIQGVPVVYIGKNAFLVSSFLSSPGEETISVVIPEGVKGIGDSAFGTTDLKSVTLPSGIHIGGMAFKNCHALEAVVLGENSTIGIEAFSLCSLKNITIPKGCTLGESAFRNSSLESVTLPEDLKVIPAWCFSGCDRLKAVKFPTSLKYIEKYAFSFSSIASVDLPEGLEYLGRNAFSSKAITSVLIPKTLKWVEHECIAGDNISNITVATGFAPKLLESDSSAKNKDVDGRNLIEGATITKTGKLQEYLSAIEVKLCFATTRYKTPRGTDFQRGIEGYKFTDEGKILYADLLSYGFSEKEAQDICAKFRQ